MVIAAIEAEADTQPCPQCGGPVRATGVLCRSCGYRLDLPAHEQPVRATAPGPGAQGAYRPPQAELAAAGLVTSSVPARWWPRVGASIVDNVIQLALAAIFGVLVYAMAGSDAGATAGVALYVVLAVVYAPVLLAFHHGQTVGKELLGVRIVNDDGAPIGFGRAFLRESVIKLAFGTFGLPYLVDVLWAVGHPRNRALHDLMVGTRPVRSWG